MAETLATPTTKNTSETAVLDPETLATGEEVSSVETEAAAETNLHDAQERLGRILDEDAAPAETSHEKESPAPATLEEARQRLSDLLNQYDKQPDETEESTGKEETKPAEDEAETSPEKKQRMKKLLRKMGNWAVLTLEAQGIIPLRGKWHQRDGFTGFIAKSYVYAKQQKAKRLAGFLSPEANAQLGGEGSPETDDDSREDEKKARLHRRLGRGAVAAARKTYRTYKAIKNVKA